MKNIIMHLFIMQLLITNLDARTFFVAKDGSGNYSSIIAAYAITIPGDTIIVKPGVYNEFSSTSGIRLNKSGTAAAPIVLKSQVRWGAVLNGENNPARERIMYIDGSYNIVDGFEMKNGWSDGVAVYGNFNRLLNNNIHDNGTIYNNQFNYGQDGIYSNDRTHDNIYIGNFVHHNGRISLNSNLDHGLYLCGSNELVANNIVVYNCTYCIQVAGYDNVKKLKIYNNTLSLNGK
jgi:hypothetical protein